MTVAELITKLQSAPQDYIVLTEQPYTALAAADTVAVGVADYISVQNGTEGCYEEHDVARLCSPPFGTPAVYIGTGFGITAIKWSAL